MVRIISEKTELFVDISSINTEDDLFATIDSNFSEFKGKYVVVDAARNPVNLAKLDQLKLAGKKEPTKLDAETFLVLPNIDSPLPMGIALREEIRYCPHHNTLTRTGQAHFSVLAHAVAEFVDNSLQATSGNSSAKNIDLFLTLDPRSHQNYLVIRDNGKGMTHKGIQDFATYFLGIDARGQTPEWEQSTRHTQSSTNRPSAFFTSFISKFGVGAIEAGFFIGTRIKVVTKTQQDVDCREFVMDELKYEERSEGSQEVFRDPIITRGCGDPVTLSESERQNSVLSNLVQMEKEADHFTYTVLSLRTPHVAKLSVNQGSGLLKALSHMYHYHMHPEHYPDFRRDIKTSLTQQTQTKRLSAEKKKNSIVSFLEMPKGAVISLSFSIRGTEPVPRLLSEYKDDLESQFIEKGRAIFTFRLEVENPDPSAVGKAKYLPVKGCIYYYPFDGHKETHPEFSSGRLQREVELDLEGDNDFDQDEENLENRKKGSHPVFEVFWQGRLVPESFVYTLPFFPDEKRRIEQREKVSDRWFQRIKGMLFFNWFFPISNNKLKLKVDPSLDHFMNDEGKLIFENGRSLKTDFNKWLINCHNDLDKEIVFLEEMEKTEHFDKFRSIRYGNSKETFSSGDHVKIIRNQKYYATILHFLLEGPDRASNFVVVRRHPIEVFGEENTQKLPLSRLDHDQGKVTEEEWVLYAESQINRMPCALKLTDLDTNEKLPKVLRLTVGTKDSPQTAIGAAILDGAGQEISKKPNGQTYQMYLELHGADHWKRRSLAPHSQTSNQYRFKPFRVAKSGVHQLVFRVSDGKRELLRTKVKVICSAGKPTALRIDGDFSDVVSLGFNCPLPAFSLSLMDEKDNHCGFEQPFVSIEAEGLRVVCQEESTLHQIQTDNDNDSGETITYQDGGWIAYVEDEPFLSNIEVAQKEVLFKVCVTSLYQEQKLVFEGSFWLTFGPGPPDKLSLLADVEPGISIQNGDSLPKIGFGLYDFNGNRVAPGRNQVWMLIFGDNFTENGSLKYQGITEAVVDATGCGYFHGGIQVELEGEIPTRGVLCTQYIVLEGKGIPDELVSSEIKFHVEPNTKPIRAEIWIDGEQLQGTIALSAGSSLSDLELRLFDQAGRQVDVSNALFGGSKSGVKASWGDGKWEKNLPCLCDLKVPETTGNETFELQCHFQNGDIIMFDFCIDILPLEPDHWLLEFKESLPRNRPLKIICGTDLTKILQGIKLVDCYNNDTEIPEGIGKPAMYLRGENVKPEVVNLRYERGKERLTLPRGMIIEGTPGRISILVVDSENPLRDYSFDAELVNGGPAMLQFRCPILLASEFSASHEVQIPKLGMLRDVEIQFCDQCQNPAKFAGSCELILTNNQGDIVLECEAPALSNGKTRSKFLFPEFCVECNDENITEQELTFVAVIEGKEKLKGAVMKCHFIKCQRIESISLNLSPDLNTVPLTGQFPDLVLSFKVEDGSQYIPPLESITFRNFVKRKKKRQRLELATTHEDPVPRPETGELIFRAKDIELGVGHFEFACTFEEHRENICLMFPPNFMNIDSQKHLVIVEPGEAASIVPSASSVKRLQNMSASNREGDESFRILCHSIQIIAKDAKGNATQFKSPISVTVGPMEGTEDGDKLPILDDGDEHGAIQGELSKDGRFYQFSMLMLQAGCTAAEGIYLLSFKMEGVPLLSFPFQFSTDSERLDKIRELQKKLEPMKAEVEEYEAKMAAFKSELSKLREELLELKRKSRSLASILEDFESPDESLIQLKESVKEMKQEIQDMEAVNSQRRSAVFPKNFLSMDVLALDPVAVPVQVGFVSDAQLARILSWAAGNFMRLVLVRTTDEQQKLAALAYPALSEEIVERFYIMERGGKRRTRTPAEMQQGCLPLPKVVAEGFYGHAVNLIELPERSEGLRDTLFYSIYGRTLIFKDLNSGLNYKKAQQKLMRQTGTIITMDGWRIPSTGILDKTSNYHSKMRLPYIYGQMPITDRPDYQRLKDNMKCVIASLPFLKDYARIINQQALFENEMLQTITIVQNKIKVTEAELQQLLGNKMTRSCSQSKIGSANKKRPRQATN